MKLIIESYNIESLNFVRGGQLEIDLEMFNVSNEHFSFSVNEEDYQDGERTSPTKVVGRVNIIAEPKKNPMTIAVNHKLIQLSPKIERKASEESNLYSYIPAVTD